MPEPMIPEPHILVSSRWNSLLNVAIDAFNNSVGMISQAVLLFFFILWIASSISEAVGGGTSSHESSEVF